MVNMGLESVFHCVVTGICGKCMCISKITFVGGFFNFGDPYKHRVKNHFTGVSHGSV